MWLTQEFKQLNRWRSLTWCVRDRESGNLSRCCRSPPRTRRRPCHWCEWLQDAEMQLLNSLRFIVGEGGIFSLQRKPTESLDPFAQGTVADRLAVLAFIVATVEA